MGAKQFPSQRRYPQPLGALRLRLAPTFERAEYGGVWWPYGRDITREVPHLIDDFPEARGRIDRVVYAPQDWDVVVSEVFTSRGRIKVGCLTDDRPGGLVLLRLAGAGIIRVRVAWMGPGARMPS